MSWFSTSKAEPISELNEIEEVMEQEIIEESRKQKVQNYMEDKLIKHFRSTQQEFMEFRNFTRKSFTERLLSMYTVRIPTSEPFLLSLHLTMEALKEEKSYNIEEVKSLLIEQIKGISKPPTLMQMASLMKQIYLLKLAFVEVPQHQLFLGKFLSELNIQAVEREMEEEEKVEEKPIPKKNRRWKKKNKHTTKV